MQNNDGQNYPPNQFNQPLMHNQFPPMQNQQGNTYQPQLNQPTFAHNQFAPQPLPQNIIVIPQNTAKPTPFQYQYNLPENPTVTNCPYCKEDVTTKLDYSYNMCCIVLLVLNIISFFGLIWTVFFIPIGLVDIAIFGFLTYCSRAYKHLCSRCSRELGRGAPSNGCCTANLG